jgi:hypothetical protein
VPPFHPRDLASPLCQIVRSPHSSSSCHGGSSRYGTFRPRTAHREL